MPVQAPLVLHRSLSIAEDVHLQLEVSPLKSVPVYKITQPRWKGKSLSGQEYLIQHLAPNFYFHITTAYAILRHNGVNIGKKIYLGALPYREAA